MTPARAERMKAGGSSSRAAKKGPTTGNSGAMILKKGTQAKPTTIATTAPREVMPFQKTERIMVGQKVALMPLLY
ncbi:MAG: hypothetical protein JRH11_16710 [Deltaproteobacteria bacterium]|nr:hypothetical protein [Deltaproteobacteria bacterium]